MAEDPEKREQARLDFITERDGEDAAMEFARRCFSQYCAALKEAENGGNQYGAAYREELQASVRFYEQLLASSRP